MRKLSPRPTLIPATTRKLAEQTSQIVAASSPKNTAKKLYGNARATKWFKRVVESLKLWSGSGERCMYCSGSESSDVEHFRPKADFPQLAMTWENYLWSCGVCNSYKDNQFPEGGDDLFINPAEEDPWDYFYIDEYGNLAALWSTLHDSQHPRAKSTFKIAHIDRQVVQDCRRARLRLLKQGIDDSLNQFDAGVLTNVDLALRLDDYLALPFQPDVADYFLNGPGSSEVPFRRFIEIARQAT